MQESDVTAISKKVVPWVLATVHSYQHCLTEFCCGCVNVGPIMKGKLKECTLPQDLDLISPVLRIWIWVSLNPSSAAKTSPSIIVSLSLVRSHTIFLIPWPFPIIVSSKVLNRGGPEFFILRKHWWTTYCHHITTYFFCWTLVFCNS